MPARPQDKLYLGCIENSIVVNQARSLLTHTHTHPDLLAVHAYALAGRDGEAQERPSRGQCNGLCWLFTACKHRLPRRIHERRIPEEDQEQRLPAVVRQRYRRLHANGTHSMLRHAVVNRAGKGVVVGRYDMATAGQIYEKIKE